MRSRFLAGIWAEKCDRKIYPKQGEGIALCEGVGLDSESEASQSRSRLEWQNRTVLKKKQKKASAEGENKRRREQGREPWSIPVLAGSLPPSETEVVLSQCTLLDRRCSPLRLDGWS